MGDGENGGEKPPAAKGRCPLESLLQKTYREDWRPRAIR